MIAIFLAEDSVCGGWVGWGRVGVVSGAIFEDVVLEVFPCFAVEVLIDLLMLKLIDFF